MTKFMLIMLLLTIAVVCALCGCKFALKDASAAIGALMCEPPKN